MCCKNCTTLQVQWQRWLTPRLLQEMRMLLALCLMLRRAVLVDVPLWCVDAKTEWVKWLGSSYKCSYHRPSSVRRQQCTISRLQYPGCNVQRCSSYSSIEISLSAQWTHKESVAVRCKFASDRERRCRTCWLTRRTSRFNCFFAAITSVVNPPPDGAAAADLGRVALACHNRRLLHRMSLTVHV